MSDYVKVVGGKIPDDEWERAENEMDDLEDLGLEVLKVLNFVDGPIKYVCLFNGGYPDDAAIKQIIENGWSVCPPYYSNGKISGFKVHREVQDGPRGSSS